MDPQIEPEELSHQLKKPTGEVGLQVAENLNAANRNLYSLAFEMLDLKKDEQILEIGFGNGTHFPRYFETQPDIALTGLDFSEDMCREGRKNNPGLVKEGKLAIHCSDASSTKLPKQNFDWIVALNVIYFWDPLQKYLEEIRRILKPTGSLLLGYHPKHSVEDLEFTKQNFILYEPQELNKLVAEEGFEKSNEQERTFTQTLADGTEFDSVDICTIFKKQL